VTKVWAWLKKWGAVILGGLAVLLGAGWLWKTYKGKLGKVKDKLAVAEATKKIAALRATREVLKERVGEKDEAMANIERLLVVNQRRLVAAHAGGEGLSDEEMLSELALRGY